MSQPGPARGRETQPAEDDYRLHRRFDRLGRLVGDAAMARLFESHVMVIGLGGVGSFAAEAVVRSGIGRVTLVDFDLVCVTNANRQLQALARNVGKPKATVLAERLRQINPRCEIKAVPLFYEARISDKLLGGSHPPDFVIDAIDNITAKCHLLDACRKRAIPIVCSTGASGRMDPTRVERADLSQTRVDPLAANVRRILRKHHGWPSKGDWGVPAVFSSEPMRKPFELTYDHGKGFHCVCPSGENDHHSCEDRSIIWGTAGFVTGSFGLACAAVAVEALTQA